MEWKKRGALLGITPLWLGFKSHPARCGSIKLDKKEGHGNYFAVLSREGYPLSKNSLASYQ